MQTPTDYAANASWYATISTRSSCVFFVFLALNGVEIVCTQKELADVILDVASGASDCDALELWLKTHGER